MNTTTPTTKTAAKNPDKLFDKAVDKPIEKSAVKFENMRTEVRGTLLTVASVAFLCCMFICLMMNYGIAQTLAEHSEGIYIANAIWFAVIAFYSRKKLYSTDGKYTKKEG